MASEAGAAHGPPFWFVAPGETDSFAWIAFACICLGIYGIVTLYAAFDRWAEHQSKGTPLARTIPTLLLIALLYEIFPIDHFSLLLPLTAILLALMADWSRFHMVSVPVPETDEHGDHSDPPEKTGPASEPSDGTEEPRNV